MDADSSTSAVNSRWRLLDRMPSGVRWALFLPVGLILSFVVVGMVDEAMWMSSGNVRVGQAVKENAVLAFMAALTRTLFPAVISPRPWPVGVVLFVLDFLLRATPIVFALTGHEYQRARALELLPSVIPFIAAGVVGGLIGLYLVRRVALRN